MFHPTLATPLHPTGRPHHRCFACTPLPPKAHLDPHSSMTPPQLSVNEINKPLGTLAAPVILHSRAIHVSMPVDISFSVSTSSSTLCGASTDHTHLGVQHAQHAAA
eukprot:366097-Chlamydomonas_euryale.AAC.32